MNKVQLLKITLLIVILAEEIKKVNRTEAFKRMIKNNTNLSYEIGSRF